MPLYNLKLAVLLISMIGFGFNLFNQCHHNHNIQTLQRVRYKLMQPFLSSPRFPSIKSPLQIFMHHDTLEARLTIPSNDFLCDMCHRSFFVSIIIIALFGSFAMSNFISVHQVKLIIFRFQPDVFTRQPRCPNIPCLRSANVVFR